MVPASLIKLLASGSPLIAAALNSIGIRVAPEVVGTWTELVVWVVALLVFFSPSFRAWLKFREDAK